MPYPVAYVSVVPYNPLQMSKPFLAGRLQKAATCGPGDRKQDSSQTFPNLTVPGP